MKNITPTTDVEENIFFDNSLEFWETFFTRLAEEEPSAAFNTVCWFLSLSAGAGAYYKAPASTDDELYFEIGLELLAGECSEVAMEAAVNTGFFQSGARALVGAAISDGGQNPDLRGLVEVLYIGSAFRAMLPKSLLVEGKKMLKKTKSKSRSRIK